ncbi:MAG: phosphoribosylanthranilate isomerase [Paraglaciecola sp.]|jgi:phosphoribosylanthranilate isomerase
MSFNNLKIKVCGMRDAVNIEAVDGLGIDMMGFIFYAKSSRDIESQAVEFKKHPNVSQLNVQRVGVFVNAEISFLLEKVGAYFLNYVQLHGDESVDYCQNLKSVWPTIKIIKAFSVNANFDFEQTKPYEPFCDLFLFDTKGENRGGNGVKFDWQILNKYQGMRPFLLSGGIGVDDGSEIKNLDLKMLYGVDVNSGFENAPALKNVDNLKYFIGQLKS